MTRAAAFRQGDVTKVLKAAKAAKTSLARIEIDRDGRIVAYIGEPAQDAPPADEWGARIRARKARVATERH